ncbi:dipeptidase [Arenicella xantha]|uniref:Membrane dipeptidase n=1 Tax=Arenicella xantha TaxID=644221 RepID=A0A395JGF4_9GAMM|nr:membrane dipeptidase [Arenicella xantha]RBP48546.1 membrane dipeptidase [Arenicella xantha]
MTISRRAFISSSLMLPLGLSSVRSFADTPAISKMRQFVINGNMVIGPEFGEPFDDETKAQLEKTGLTAFKLSLGGSRGSYEEVHEVLDSLPEIYASNPDTLMHINSASDLQRAYDTRRTGIIYSFEAATMLGERVERVEEFANRGVRIMQLGYNHTSPFGAGVMSTDGPLGLSKLGYAVIKQMEENEVLLDLSHAHELTADEALKTSSKPVSMTHTGCYEINPHQRNKSNKTLRATADSGGIVGIYEMSYLTADLEQQSLEAFMAHIKHALKICGEDHVGIGSDTPVLGFDTGPQSMAQWNEINRQRKETGVAAPGEGPPPYVVGINGPHKMAVISEELNARGVAPAVIDKIIGNNFARVLSDTLPA